MLNLINKSYRNKWQLLVLFFFIQVGGHCTSDTLITQKITYYTSHAGQMYMVWDINGWTLPEKRFWNEKSFLKDGMVWSKMKGDKDSFVINITLPRNMQLDFMFWIPINPSGDSTNGWDTYGDQTYSSKFVEHKTMNMDDRALWMPSKKEFNIFEHGWRYFFISFAVSTFLIVPFRKKLLFSSTSLIIGSLLASIVVVAMVRVQMNSRLGQNRGNIFGAMFPDLVWFFSIGIFFILVMFLLRKFQKIRTSIAIFSVSIILLSVLFSLINIEIVKFLGRPVNYQWLYYSDFMAGSDAKSAVARGLTPTLITSLSLFLGGILLFAFAFSMLPASFSKKINSGIGIFGLVVFSLGFYQNKNLKYKSGKIENPVWELVSSTITSEKSSKLFSMEVSDEVRTFIKDYHNQTTEGRYDTSGVIKNIILFVLESTPYDLVSVYDSAYNVTPNIKRWTNISTIYTNMYAHLPATVYSMGNMVAGVYPLIGHQSMVASYPANTVPSISSELKKQGWTSSLFFGADLAYSNMGLYARNQKFDVTDDNTTIECRFAKFGGTNSFLDQLDDRCLVERYFQWSDSVPNKKKLSMLWTTQTHHHYLFKNKEVEYVKGNKDLNRYLNALRENDEAFGMLMDGLKQRDMLNNTLVILTADHGEAFGTHDQIIHATKIYEENIHVPFILYNPILFNGKINNRVAGLIDIPPTLSHLIGLKKPAEWQGKSLLTGGSDKDRTFFICPFNDFLFGTRTGKWKFIYNAAKNEGELYNLEADPKELNNVAAQFADIAKKEFEMIAGWVQYHNKKIYEYVK